MQPVLPVLERCDSRHRADQRGSLDGHVLELVRDHIRPVCQPGERRVVVVGTDDELSHLASARIGRRVEEPEREPEGKAREPEHPSELTAADAADERHECRRQRWC